MESSEVDDQTGQIIDVCQQIFDNLGIEFLLQELSDLCREDIYIELFMIMFPSQVNQIVEIQQKKVPVATKLEKLISFLATEILSLDLSHIKAYEISVGNTKHLLNFLQILYQLSVLYKQKLNEQLNSGNNDKKQDVKKRRNSDQYIDVDQQQKIGDFADSEANKFDQKLDKKSRKKQPQIPQPTQSLLKHSEKKNIGDKNEQVQNIMHDQLMDQLHQNIMQQGDVEYYDEDEQQYIINKSSDDEQQQRGQEDQDKDHNFDGSTTKYRSGKPPKQEQELGSGSKSESSGHKQPTVPKYYGIKKVHPLDKKDMKNQIANQLLSQVNTKQRNLYPYTEKNSLKKQTSQKKQQYQFKKEDIERLTKLEEMIEKGEVPYEDPELIKYIRQMQEQLEIQKNRRMISPEDGIDQLQNLNLENIISDQLKNVKNGLNNLKNYKEYEDDRNTIYKVQKQKQQYRQFLKEFGKDLDVNTNRKQLSKNNNEKNNAKKMKTLMTESKSLQKEYQNEQKSLYYKLRDEKINYLRKIHRIIFELEKRKLLDEKNQYKKERAEKNEDTRNVLESIENAYRDRIDMLKENLQKKRKERKVAQGAQKEVITRIEKELKLEKQKQIDEIRDLWKQEKQRFDLLVKDDGVMEQKIMELYKKY